MEAFTMKLFLVSVLADAYQVRGDNKIWVILQ
jgi:hypothetical protein